MAYIDECPKQAATQTAGKTPVLVKAGRFSGLNITGQHEGNTEGNCWCNCPTSQWSTDVEIDQMTDGGHSTQEVWTGRATAPWPRPGDCSAINTPTSSDVLTLCPPCNL